MQNSSKSSDNPEPGPKKCFAKLKNGWGSMSYDSKATGKRQKEFI